MAMILNLLVTLSDDQKFQNPERKVREGEIKKARKKERENTAVNSVHYFLPDGTQTTLS